MLAKLEQHSAPLSATAAKSAKHLLVVLPKTAKPDARTPYLATLAATLARSACCASHAWARCSARVRVRTATRCRPDRR